MANLSTKRTRSLRAWWRLYWRWALIVSAVLGTLLIFLLLTLLPANLAGMLLVLPVGGAVFFCALIFYQFASAWVDRRRLPPPGTLIQMDGFRLHVQAEGSGAPTVIIDAGLNANSLDWWRVWPQLAADTRVVLWDRAGHGWSDVGPHYRTSARIADELYSALEKAGISGPYVLVGQDFGGLNMRLFAAKHPDEVVGMVLINPLHENYTGWLASLGSTLKDMRHDLAYTELAARLGWLRMFRGKLFPRLLPLIDALPPRVQAMYRALVYLPKGYATSQWELDVLHLSFEEMREAARDVPYVPTAVISRADDPLDFFSRSGIPRYEQLRFEVCDMLAERAPYGEHVVIEPRDEYTPIALEEPRLVIDVIADVVALARSYSRLEG